MCGYNDGCLQRAVCPTTINLHGVIAHFFSSMSRCDWPSDDRVLVSTAESSLHVELVSVQNLVMRQLLF